MTLSGFQLVNLGLLTLLVTSCNNDLQCVDRSDSQQDPFKNVQVQVGVQGSNAMSGFVSRPGTRYANVIQKLDVILGTSTTQPKYWRLGRNLEKNVTDPISMTELSEAEDPLFYDCHQPEKYFFHFSCVTSTLEQIYDFQGEKKTDEKPKQNFWGTLFGQPNGGKQKQKILKILVTDLENDDGDVKKLVNKITELNTEEGYSTVLLGMRSEYNGKIYPLKHNGIPFSQDYPDYSTDGKDINQKGRPFYIIMTGPSVSVDEVVKQLKQQLPSNISQAFRASSFGETEIVTLDKTALPAPDSCITQTGAINGTRPTKNQENQWLLMQLCTTKKTLNIEIPSEKAATLVGASLSPEMFEVNNSVVKVQEVKVNGDKMTLKISLDVQNIHKNTGKGIYNITLKRRTLDDAVWKDWNTQDSASDGEKTRNLELFVSGLRGAVDVRTKETKRKESTQEAVKYCLGFARK